MKSILFSIYLVLWGLFLSNKVCFDGDVKFYRGEISIYSIGEVGDNLRQGFRVHFLGNTTNMGIVGNFEALEIIPVRTKYS